MSAQTRVTARFVAALSVAIILASQVNLWVGLLGENAANAMTSLDRIGTSLVTISSNTDGATEKNRIRAFADALPEDAQLLRLDEGHTSGTGAGSLVLTGSCRALQAIHAACSTSKVPLAWQGRDPRITELMRWTALDINSAIFAQVHAVDAAKQESDGMSSMIVISASGVDLSVPGLRELVRTKLGMKATAEPLGNSWLVGAKDLAASASWVHLLGLLGCLATVLAFGLSAFSEFLEFAREVAPLTVLTNSNALLGTISGWSLLFPAILASAIGGVVAFWLTTPITVAGRQQSSSNLYPILAMGAAGSASLLCLWAWRSAVLRAASWRPVSG
ncbi:hypothetical protein [Streptomyces triticiradicis]|uniref:ABC transporter permease n=1 Tax=Streptomyces triticiradicis TaxID=2651189 RepID=A0A7J5D5V6_9ACTN|nr:hypothetical protein [Streptomyces triticiradicis]KAB1979461.1 hypothetical protein F8144_36225 [Streptomyces triticiradicis]